MPVYAFGHHIADVVICFSMFFVAHCCSKVAVYMKEVFSASECFIAIKLDMRAIQDLHLDVNVHSVRQSILKGNFGETRPRVLRDLKPQHVVISAGGHKVLHEIRRVTVVVLVPIKLSVC